MRMRNFIAILFLLCHTLYSIGAESLNLLPIPQHFSASKGYFNLRNVRINSTTLLPQWQEWITDMGGSVGTKSTDRSIAVVIKDSIKSVPINQNEAYRLVVTPNKILVEATTETGVYLAMQTLRQLKKEGNEALIKCCTITDYPAFRVRGFMLDVGRSYMSLTEIKRQIDILSRYKVNVFHWHLTENQSWRLESKIFPMLNDSINTTRMPGKYYTLNEAKELVEYCKARHITLIPEFDMPGHSAAFVRTFRHDMQSTEGIKILKLLMDEVCETFDVPYIHIGTDEVEFHNPDFVSEMVTHIRSKGKKTISWNPGWKYKPGEIDMTHLWSYRGKAQPGIPAIDSKFHYLNHFDTFGDIIALYNSRICNVEQGRDDIAGVILAIWNDRYVNGDNNILLENNFYPSMLAMAERAWKGGGTEYFDKCGTILRSAEQPEYKAFADFERRMLYHKKINFKDLPFPYVKQTHIKWNITDPFPNGGDLSKSFPPEKELKEEYSFENKIYNVSSAIGAAVYLRHVWGTLVPSFYKEPKENHTAYAYTYVYSPKNQEVGLMAEFQNYSRSEMDLAPKPGKWDYKDSRMWINDNEILPPSWSSTHTVKSNETPLGNENCAVRPPIKITLNKGWNKVLLKLPVGKFTTPEVRLIKWMFTVAFVNNDGESDSSLIFSPRKTK